MRWHTVVPSVLLSMSALLGCGYGEDNRPAPRTGSTDSTVRGDVDSIPPSDFDDALILSSARTVRPQWSSEQIQITASGMVAYDTRRLHSIPAPFAGRIEVMDVHAVFQQVRKGQRLMVLFSPELVAAQNELVFLLESDSTNTALVEGAVKRLELLGLTGEQIDALKRRRKSSDRLSIFSPYSGYVIDALGTPPLSSPSSAVPRPSAAGGGGMATMGGGGSAASTQMPVLPDGSGTPLQLHEGQYVQRGEILLRLVDPRQLWVELQMRAQDAAGIRSGAPVTLTFDQLRGASRQARVSSIAPVLDQPTQRVTVRVDLPGGSTSAPVGQLARATIVLPSRSALWVPESAVLDLGDRQVVFRKVTRGFRPVGVRVGVRSQGRVEIHSGISETDEIAEQAQLLVDSESAVRLSTEGRR
jgi:membrane fusion protein, copper/silver efflux system